MRRFQMSTGAVVAVFALSSPGAARPQTPPVIEVTLTSYSFEPRVLRLRLGEEQILRLSNRRGSHDFSSPALFAASRLDEGSAALVRDGRVELDSGQTVELRLTPLRAGTYPLRCTHLFHSTFGMNGQVIVE